MYKIPNSELTVLILEEDPYAALELESLIKTTGYQTITISNIAKIPATPPNDYSYDLIMLNISRKEDTVYLEAISRLKNQANIPIIHTASYSNGVSINNLSKVLLRKVMREAILKLDIQACIDTYKALISNKYLYFLKKGVYYKINISDILFIKAEDDYSILYTKEGCITIFLSLNKIMLLLKGYPFIRTHRSFLINTDKASFSTADGSTILIDKHQVPISRSRKKKIAALGLEKILAI